MSISLNKSILTPKVSNGVGNMMQYMRTFQMPADVNYVNVDSYGRGPISVYSGNYPQLNSSLGVYSARFSPLYRIDVENAQRPQYSQYLNVPQGLMMFQSEYTQRPYVDLMGVNRDRAFGMDGMYARPQPPINSTNPDSEKDWMMNQDWVNSRAVNKFSNSTYVESQAAMEAGGKTLASGF